MQPSRRATHPASQPMRAQQSATVNTSQQARRVAPAWPFPRDRYIPDSRDASPGSSSSSSAESRSSSSSEREMKTYANVLRAPVVDRLQSPRSTSPRPAPAPSSQPAGSRKIPPITVESLPNWPLHLEELRRRFGRTPAARPLGTGLRLLPGTEEEYHAIKDYLSGLEKTVPSLSWYTYSLRQDRPIKVALRGLPTNTDPNIIIEDLRARGFPVNHARNLPPLPGRVNSTVFLQFSMMSRELQSRLFNTTELLNMPHVSFEAWRGSSKIPQCHRCQAFGHASALCHRPQRCVKCGGPHHGRECTSSPDAPKKCANCAEPHAANNRTCRWFLREARKRAIPIPGDRRPPAQPAPPPLQRQPPQQWRVTRPPSPVLQRATPKRRLELPSPAPERRPDSSGESPQTSSTASSRRRRRGRRGRGTPSPRISLPQSPSLLRSPRSERGRNTPQAAPVSAPRQEKTTQTEPQSLRCDSATEVGTYSDNDSLLESYVGLLTSIVAGDDLRASAARALDELRALAEPRARRSITPHHQLPPTSTQASSVQGVPGAASTSPESVCPGAQPS